MCSLNFYSLKDFWCPGLIFLLLLLFLFPFSFSFHPLSECCFLVLSQLWGTGKLLTFAFSLGEGSELLELLLLGAGADCESSHSPLFLWLAPAVTWGPEGWNSDLWLLALLFLFKNRSVCGVLPSSVPCSHWRQTEAATKQTEVAEENLPRCSVRDPGPQLQAATI